MHIVLIEPEIPQNTGNIARTCALTGTALHLIKPLGFSVEDRYLKRAGLDYWDQVEVKIWDNFSQFLEKHEGNMIYYATSRAKKHYNEPSYSIDDIFVFGSESRGISPEILEKYAKQKIKIPMINIGRSLNLSNAVSVILYEALRQNNFGKLV